MVKYRLQQPILSVMRGGLAAASVAVLATFVVPGNALALSELQQEEMQLPDDQGSDAIERRDLPPPGGGKSDGKVKSDTSEPAADKQGIRDEQQDSAPDRAAPVQPSQTQRPSSQRPASERANSGRTDSQRPGMTVPLPDPVVILRDPEAQPADAVEDADADEPIPEVFYDLSLLPKPVQRMRKLIVEACLSGDIERLRPLIGTGENGTQLSFGDTGGDPIKFLRELSGDEHGHEILAILYEVFSAGYIHLSPDKPDEIYIWPYFFAVPLEALTAPQRVELFKIVTAGDYEEMKNYGAYIFYRAGISPEGRWQFFVAGD